MKFYKNLVEAVTDCLKQIMLEKKYSDRVIEKTFKLHPQWGARDRRFIAEAVYDITRYYRYLSFIAGTEKNFTLIFAAYLFLKNEALPEWPDYQTINTKLFLLKKNEIISDAIRLSYPDELWHLCEDELDKEVWLKEAEALNQPASVVLRCNTLKIKKEELHKKLTASEIETEYINGYDDALLLKKRKNVFSSSLFKDGLFEVQDAGSQSIAPFLNAGGSQKVIDACAGAGGKTLHLAALMKNKGRIISLDTEAWKLDELRKRAKRAGVNNMETRLIENNKTIKQLEGSADRLLLDVPCSGTGVIKRNPDAKWKLTSEIIEKTKHLQYTILRDYPSMLKPGGKLVYSTCSILPSENQSQVSRFLSEHPDFELEFEKTILPGVGFDGFYMARITKN
jgi:16S rRNA (cytosine967-C5)-methyltransferase